MKRYLWTLLLLVLLSACGGSEADEGAGPAPSPVSAGLLPTPTLARPVATAPGKPAPATITPAPTSAPTQVPSPTASPTIPPPTATPASLTFAVIGDYGQAGPGEAAVAALVKGWRPDLILTTGDNNYPNGEAATIDANVGQYYASYISPYFGTYTTTTASEANRFFPTLGNHDYYSPQGPQPYLDYFTLPGNERYYEFEREPVHFFALNSDFNEPDGVGAGSRQAQWLQAKLAASTAPWKIVYMHVPPFSSGHHGSGEWMRWPFAAWGTTAVISGHDHHYERLLVDGIPYFVNGLGGGAIYALKEPLPGSENRFTGAHGALRVEATADTLTFEFFTRDGDLIDRHTLAR